MSEPQDIAFEIVLEKRERSYAFGEPRARFENDIGATAALPPESEQQRSDVIKALVEKFENITVDQVSANHGILTTDPYVSVANGNSLSVTRALAEQTASQQPANSEKARTEIQNLRILLSDDRTAVVTYAISEGGKSSETAVICSRQDDGAWKISVHCPHPVT